MLRIRMYDFYALSIIDKNTHYIIITMVSKLQS